MIGLAAPKLAHRQRRLIEFDDHVVAAVVVEDRQPVRVPAVGPFRVEFLLRFDDLAAAHQVPALLERPDHVGALSVVPAEPRLQIRRQSASDEVFEWSQFVAGRAGKECLVKATAMFRQPVIDLRQQRGKTVIFLGAGTPPVHRRLLRSRLQLFHQIRQFIRPRLFPARDAGGQASGPCHVVRRLARTDRPHGQPLRAERHGEPLAADLDLAGQRSREFLHKIAHHLPGRRCQWTARPATRYNDARDHGAVDAP
jgi:hypothetical protein